MCLGVPVRITGIGADSQATVDLGGVQREVDLTLVPEAVVGDYVLLHAGYALQRLDEREARITLDLLEELADFGEKDIL